jgi:hypothetical protein
MPRRAARLTPGLAELKNAYADEDSGKEAAHRLTAVQLLIDGEQLSRCRKAFDAHPRRLSRAPHQHHRRMACL